MRLPGLWNWQCKKQSAYVNWNPIRQRALSEPDKKWYWLAQAAKYQVQANQKLAFHSEEANAPDSPEIKLAQWSHVRDERRVMEPLPDGRRTPW